MQVRVRYRRNLQLPVTVLEYSATVTVSRKVEQGYLLLLAAPYPKLCNHSLVGQPLSMDLFSFGANPQRQCQIWMCRS